MQQEKVNIDEKLLTEIARETGGKYFRASGNESLENIYADIDALEKTKIEINTTRKYNEKFYPLVFTALIFILLEVLIQIYRIQEVSVTYVMLTLELAYI